MELGQGINFETKAVSNYLLLRLPSGQKIRAGITEDEAQEVVHLFVHEGKAEPEPTEKPSTVASMAEETFTEEPEEDGTSSLVMESLPAIRRKHRLVGKDSAGNPLVEYDGGVDPLEVTGANGVKDEDGVSQL